MTNLLEVYSGVNYSNSRPSIKAILDELQLLDFQRERLGKIQKFSFCFTYREKKYTLEHYFLYHWKGIDNWFKLKKPSIFTLAPFSLNKNDLCKLSEELMIAVNEWNKIEG
ncbi:hypothetical protein [Priestia megaterium]|uniref:Uncharacterized protein n=1 Tax=Priestia megaterium TaxID=1404 RepID=A0A6M6EBP7_PRIMG|nr:hypothetical protein [Priestia megaterium]QJX80935.1 hypothetical protein FDZ14_33120 [Priestia megaterium]